MLLGVLLFLQAPSRYPRNYPASMTNPNTLRVACLKGRRSQEEGKALKTEDHHSDGLMKLTAFRNDAIFP